MGVSKTMKHIIATSDHNLAKDCMRYQIITKIAEHRHTHSSTIWPPISSFLPSTPLDYQKTID